MKCDKAVNNYLKLDNNTQMPFLLKLHVIFCRDCRREISGLRNLFFMFKNDSSYKKSYDMSSSIMEIIRRESIYTVKTISGFKWGLIGMLIFLSILLLNFSESFIWLKNEFGSDYTIPLSIVMGFILTAYSSIVVGCNYENIKKYIAVHSRWKMK
jgi:hypothetical protein